jgi:hypothetical protein
MILPDLLTMEIDLFIKETLQAALEAANGDAQLAAGLKQSPRRFFEEAERLGVLPREEGRIIPTPQPETIHAPDPEVLPEAAHPQEAQGATGDARGNLLVSGQQAVDGGGPPKGPRKGKPGRPPGRRRSPLGVEPPKLPVRGRVSGLREVDGDDGDGGEAFPEAEDAEGLEG